MGEAMFDRIVSEQRRHLAIAQRPVVFFCDSSPRTEMDFIDRKRFAPCLSVLSLIHPATIAELVFRLKDNRGGLRRDFHGKSIRIGFEELMPARLDLVLVEFTLAQAGNEKVPNAAITQPSHEMLRAIPIIEVTNDANAF